MDLHQIDQINLDQLTSKYRLLDKLSANHLAKLGYYKAIEVRGGPEKSKLGDRLEKKKKKSFERIESQLEKIMGYKNAERFLEHLELIMETGEKDGILGDTDAMVKEAHRHCRSSEINDELLRENLVIFTELVAFGYRYKVEGGVPEKKNDEKSAKRKKAEKRIEAVERRNSDGVGGMVKNLLGF